MMPDVIVRNLRTVMKANHVTQQQLADMVGRTRATVARWVTGKQYPDAFDLYNISKVFNVSVDWLLGLTDQSPVLLNSAEYNVVLGDKKIVIRLEDI